METEVSEQKEEGFFSQSTGKSAPRSTKTDLRKVRHVISASVSAQEISKQKIEMFREQRRKKQILFQNIKVIKRSEKIFQALKLPKVLNVNPRSLYNKKNEFCTFIEEESIDLACISESFERKNFTLEKLLELENFKILSNVYQREGKGGRPAIVVNTDKYEVENLTQTHITIPWGVEIVWAALTPKNVNKDSKIQKIVVGSVYSKPKSRKKSILLDHIAQVYSQMSSKYKKGLHWIICGDTNDLFFT